jgi:hypothetical protein
MYIDVIIGNPKKIPITYPRIAVKIICPIPVINAAGPTSLITFGDKCSPTINSKNAIPISEKTFRVSVFSIRLRKKGPTKIPDKI